MARQIALILLCLGILVGCGKNDGFRALPPPITQAPPPPNGGYYNPQGGMPNGGVPYGGIPNGGGYQNPYGNPYGSPYGGYPGGGNYMPQNPYFQPQLPPGYGRPYTPFLPIDDYFRRTPPHRDYWMQFWVEWQHYARLRGYSEHDFNRFWYEYCPMRWSGGQYWDFYQHYSRNVYFWTTPNTRYGESDPQTFWQYYYGMPYDEMDGYYCPSRCR